MLRKNAKGRVGRGGRGGKVGWGKRVDRTAQGNE